MKTIKINQINENAIAADEAEAQGTLGGRSYKTKLKWPLITAAISLCGYAIFRVGLDLSINQNQTNLIVSKTLKPFQVCDASKNTTPPNTTLAKSIYETYKYDWKWIPIFRSCEKIHSYEDCLDYLEPDEIPERERLEPWTRSYRYGWNQALYDCRSTCNHGIDCNTLTNSALKKSLIERNMHPRIRPDGMAPDLHASLLRFIDHR